MRVRRWIAIAALLPVACATADLGEDDPLRLPDRDDAGDAALDAAQPEVDPMDAGGSGDAAVSGGPRVFVTSTTSNSNFGGLPGGDLMCTNLAIGAGLIGKWAAWLSVSGGPHASDRVTSAGPWRLVNGDVVARTKAELVSGTLRHAINRDEKGALVPASRVWTGSGVDGRYLSNDCDKWRNGGNGRVGDTSSTTATWTTAGVDDCGQLRRVYCFEL